MVKKSANKADSSGSSAALPEVGTKTTSEAPRTNGGWQEIEARREKAALKESLADVWDEDFDLDDEILAELEHKPEFFTKTEAVEEVDLGDDDAGDEYFEDDTV